MKRKRASDQLDDQLTCDLVLTDANGRSVRVHKALLVDRSDYFANLLSENNLSELQLDENYLIELLQYLYNHESEDHQRANSHNIVSSPLSQSLTSSGSTSKASNPDQAVCNEELVILMQLLNLSKKYSFKKLYQSLTKELHYKLGPSTVITIYNCAKELNIEEFQTNTKMMILSWLPDLQKTDSFSNLSEQSIYDIFSIEAPEVDNECKLNALSAWWSHNSGADMTNLWVKLITHNENNK